MLSMRMPALSGAFRMALTQRPCLAMLQHIVLLLLDPGKSQEVSNACRDTCLEQNFQKDWAVRRIANDKAVLILYILLLLGIETADFAFGRAGQVGTGHMVAHACVHASYTLSCCSNCRMLTANLSIYALACGHTSLGCVLEVALAGSEGR